MSEELRRTRRELAAARRALQERRFARSQPIGPETTVLALTAVLQHTLPAAIAELQRERERLTRELRHAREMLVTQKNRYTSLRYEVWRWAAPALRGEEWPDAALSAISDLVSDSDDDLDWEQRNE